MAVLVLALLLGGCAGHTRGVLLPVASTEPGTDRVDIVVATTRKGRRRPG